MGARGRYLTDVPPRIREMPTGPSAVFAVPSVTRGYACPVSVDMTSRPPVPIEE